MAETLEQLCEDFRVRIHCAKSEAPLHGDWLPNSKHWCVRLVLDGRELRSEYHQGPAHKLPPTAHDVLSCLLLDGQAGAQTFGDFCGDFGLDTDSRKAYATWEACVRINEDLAQWFARPGLRARFERSEQP